MFTARHFIRLTGCLWLLIGAWLFYKGFRLTAYGSFDPHGLASFLGGPGRGTSILVTIALAIGFAKGKFVLSKTVRRIAMRLLSIKGPISFKNAYPPAYWFLIGGMMCLGMLMNVLPISMDTRGFIDLAIGAALIYGALQYFMFPVVVLQK